jgi:hypothetical protein
MKEGREARKNGRERVSPYENIATLRAFHVPWLRGYDAMNELMRPANH